MLVIDETNIDQTQLPHPNSRKKRMKMYSRPELVRDRVLAFFARADACYVVKHSGGGEGPDEERAVGPAPGGLRLRPIEIQTMEHAAQAHAHQCRHKDLDPRHRSFNSTKSKDKAGTPAKRSSTSTSKTRRSGRGRASASTAASPSRQPLLPPEPGDKGKGDADEDRAGSPNKVRKNRQCCGRSSHSGRTREEDVEATGKGARLVRAVVEAIRLWAPVMLLVKLMVIIYLAGYRESTFGSANIANMLGWSVLSVLFLTGMGSSILTDELLSSLLVVLLGVVASLVIGCAYASVVFFALPAAEVGIGATSALPSYPAHVVFFALAFPTAVIGLCEFGNQYISGQRFRRPVALTLSTITTVVFTMLVNHLSAVEKVDMIAKTDAKLLETWEVLGEKHGLVKGELSAAAAEGAGLGQEDSEVEPGRAGEAAEDDAASKRSGKFLGKKHAHATSDPDSEEDRVIHSEDKANANKPDEEQQQAEAEAEDGTRAGNGEQKNHASTPGRQEVEGRGTEDPRQNELEALLRSLYKGEKHIDRVVNDTWRAAYMLVLRRAVAMLIGVFTAVLTAFLLSKIFPAVVQLRRARTAVLDSSQFVVRGSFDVLLLHLRAYTNEQEYRRKLLGGSGSGDGLDEAGERSSCSDEDRLSLIEDQRAPSAKRLSDVPGSDCAVKTTDDTGAGVSRKLNTSTGTTTAATGLLGSPFLSEDLRPTSCSGLSASPLTASSPDSGRLSPPSSAAAPSPENTRPTTSSRSSPHLERFRAAVRRVMWRRRVLGVFSGREQHPPCKKEAEELHSLVLAKLVAAKAAFKDNGTLRNLCGLEHVRRRTRIETCSGASTKTMSLLSVAAHDRHSDDDEKSKAGDSSQASHTSTRSALNLIRYFIPNGIRRVALSRLPLSDFDDWAELPLQQLYVRTGTVHYLTERLPIPMGELCDTIVRIREAMCALMSDDLQEMLDHGLRKHGWPMVVGGEMTASCSSVVVSGARTTKKSRSFLTDTTKLHNLHAVGRSRERAVLDVLQGDSSDEEVNAVSAYFFVVWHNFELLCEGLADFAACLHEWRLEILPLVIARDERQAAYAEVHRQRTWMKRGASATGNVDDVLLSSSRSGRSGRLVHVDVEQDDDEKNYASPAAGANTETVRSAGSFGRRASGSALLSLGGGSACAKTVLRNLKATATLDGLRRYATRNYAARINPRLLNRMNTTRRGGGGLHRANSRIAAEAAAVAAEQPVAAAESGGGRGAGTPRKLLRSMSTQGKLLDEEGRSGGPPEDEEERTAASKQPRCCHTFGGLSPLQLRHALQDSSLQLSSEDVDGDADGDDDKIDALQQPNTVCAASFTVLLRGTGACGGGGAGSTTTTPSRVGLTDSLFGEQSPSDAAEKTEMPALRAAKVTPIQEMPEEDDDDEDRRSAENLNAPPAAGNIPNFTSEPCLVRSRRPLSGNGEDFSEENEHLAGPLLGDRNASGLSQLDPVREHHDEAVPVAKEVVATDELCRRGRKTPAVPAQHHHHDREQQQGINYIPSPQEQDHSFSRSFSAGSAAGAGRCPNADANGAIRKCDNVQYSWQFTHFLGSMAYLHDEWAAFSLQLLKLTLPRDWHSTYEIRTKLQNTLC